MTFFGRASHRALVIVGKLFDTENGDDVLQILVALQNGFDRARHGVVIGANDARVENARIAGEWIDGRINAAFDDLARKVCSCVQMSERGSRSRVGVVVGGHINCLHRSDLS